MVSEDKSDLFSKFHYQPELCVVSDKEFYVGEHVSDNVWSGIQTANHTSTRSYAHLSRDWSKLLSITLRQNRKQGEKGTAKALHSTLFSVCTLQFYFTGWLFVCLF